MGTIKKADLAKQISARISKDLAEYVDFEYKLMNGFKKEWLVVVSNDLIEKNITATKVRGYISARYAK